MLIRQPKATTKIKQTWRPHPGPQTFFLTSPWMEGLYGGAAGGGKTEALINDPVPDLLTYPGATAIFFRREFSQLEDVEHRMLELFTPLGAKYNSSKHRFTFPNGSRYYIGHLQHEKDKLKHQGREYGIIIFDELTHFTETMYLYLLSRNRDKNLPEHRWRTRAGTNPGGPGHGWVKRRFIDCLEPYKYRWFLRWQGEDLPVPEGTPNARSRFFVPATVKDNPIYAGGQYEANLLSLDEQERRMLYEGDWEVFQGQFFYMWRKGLHVIPQLDWLSPHWNYFGALDWGDVSPFCYLILAVDQQKNVIVVDELYDIAWSIELIAKEINAMEAKLPKPVSSRVADYNIFGKRVAEFGEKPVVDSPEIETLEKMFKSHGLSFGRATKNRILGWAAVKEYMRWEGEFYGDPSTVKVPPRLKITTDCPNLIRTLPDLVYAGSDGTSTRVAEDIEQRNAEDHAPDTLRYGIMHVFEPRPKVKKPGGWLEELKQQSQNPGERPVW